MSCCHCISSIRTDFVCYFCRSLSFLRQFFPYFVFLCRSFPFLRHCSVFVLRCRFPTAFRQFSQTLFAFSIVLCPFYVSSFLTLSFLVVVTPSYVTAVYLSVAVVSPLYFVNSLRPCFLSCRLCSLFAFFVVLCLSYVSPFLSSSFSVVPSLSYVAVVCCRFPTAFRQFSPCFLLSL